MTKVEERVRELRQRTIKKSNRSLPPVLVINGYAGSLTVAATQLGLPILGSFEDCGHGLDAQRHNFPDLPYIEATPWPEMKLSDALVIAHPPCAGFCAQNVNAPARDTSRGLDGTYFAQTKAVLEYTLPRKPLAVLVESVKGAYEPTRAFYDELAAKHKYHVFRVLQNAVTFGTAQWRPRFWAVLVRKDVCPTPFVFQHDADRKCVAEVLDRVKPGEKILGVERCSNAQREKLLANFPKRVVDEIFAGEHGYGAMNRILPKAGLVTVKKGHDRDFLKKYCYSLFVSNNPVILDPEGYAPTVMSTSVWWYGGKMLTAAHYNALMGYPHSYWFPQPKHLSLRSQGVCPPVAKWLLEQVIANLTGKQQQYTVNMTSVQALKPGETANFLIGRGEWAQRDFQFNRRGPATETPQDEGTPTKRPKARVETPKRVSTPRTESRYRLVATPGVGSTYLKELLLPATKTHNAAVAKVLRAAGRAGLTFAGIMTAVLKTGWRTTSPNPESIIRWHVGHLLNERHLLERV